MSVTGPGNLWMEAEDEVIAKNMHHAIMNVCAGSSSRKTDLLPKSRARSFSINEGSKPIEVSRSSYGDMRERCDSMPSRARSNTETLLTQGGTRIGHSTRPLTTHARGLSYSPPVASSPVSPQSGGCSTDSAGSSLSMDGDGEPWTGDDNTANENSYISDMPASRYCHSGMPEEPVIMEENSDDYVQWSGEDAKLNNYMPMDRSTTGNFSLQIIPPVTNLSNASYRKYPLSNSSFKSHSPSQSSFNEAFSPNNSFLADPSGYTPMSPGEGENTTDGYVPMAPTFRDDGHVNVNADFNKIKGGSHSLAGSSTSITSGTPSTDLRFSEYHLDKVKSYFSPVEDEHEEQRPTRAYSIGSRPEKLKNKNARMEHVDKSDNLRVRAFSVGSRPNIRPNIPKKHPACFVSSSLSSMEQSDDLMEIDFSRVNQKSKKKKSQEHLIVPSAMSSSASSYSTAEGSCMDISPRCSPKLVAGSSAKTSSPDLVQSPPRAVFSKSYIGRSPPKGSHHSLLDHHLPRLSPPGHGYYISPTLHKVSEAPVGYVDMCPGTGGELLLAVSPPKHMTNVQGDSSMSSYVDMKPGSDSRQSKKEIANPRLQNFPTIKPALLNTAGKVPHLPKWDSKHESANEESHQNEYIEVDMKRKVSRSEDNNNGKSRDTATGAVIDSPKQVCEGYVEMSWNNPHATAEKLGVCNENQDYINMNLDRDKRKEVKTRRTVNKGRYSSQPISIKANQSNDDSSVTSPISASVAQKFLTGASPKIPSFLPVGYRSMTRWDSKESSSSNSGVSTPTNSNSTMFPLILSCPTSPSQDNYEMCPKIPVDATSGTVKISYPANSNSSSSCVSKSLESVQEVDHTSDYVNYYPKIPPLEENSNPYTVMKPRKAPPSMSRKSSVPANLGTSSKNKMLDKLQKSLTYLTISSSLTNSSSSSSNKQKNSGHTSSVNNNVNVNNCNISSSGSNPNDNNSNYSNICANDTNTPQNQTKVPSVATTNDYVCLPLNVAGTKSAVSVAAKQPEPSTTTVPALSQSLSGSNSSESLKTDDKLELTRQISSSSGSCSDASTVSSTPFFGSIRPPTISYEKEIQYATLDLARSDSEEGILKSENGPKSSADQASNQPTYAEIDFSKSAPAAAVPPSDPSQRH